MRTKKWLGASFVLFLIFGLASLQAWKGGTKTVWAEEREPQPIVRQAVAFAKTVNLRDWQKAPVVPVDEKKEIPNRPLPRRPQEKQQEAEGGSGLVQEVPRSEVPLPLSPASIVRAFPGPSNADNASVIGGMVAPPDINGDVGPNHIVVMTNLVTTIYDRNGTALVGPVANNFFWSTLPSTSLCRNNNDGDPVVLYDQLADRWLVSQFALDFATPEFHQCIAISETGDPTGPWFAYDFLISTTKMNDYPKLGVWPDAYYMAINQFDFSGSVVTWGGQGVVAFERDKMLVGDPTARMVYFDLYSLDPNLGGMLPSHLEGPTPPPAGEPNYFVQMDDDAWGYTSQDQLQIWAFRVDWTTPSNSTFTHVANIPVAPFDSNMCNYDRNCIPQRDSTQRLDAISDRLMFRLQYRNFGSYQTLVVNHTVDVSGGDKAGIRWYELRKSGSGWSVYQQGTFAVADAHVWMASVAMNGLGDIMIGYTLSGPNDYPSVHFTAREAGDPLGQMTYGDNVIVAGGGSQEDVARWGDYTSMSVDPVDDCTFWYFGEYVATTGPWQWNTYVAAITMPGCTSGGTLRGQVTDASTGQPVEGAIVTLSPGGAWTTTDANGEYVFNALPAGSYDITVDDFYYQAASATGVSVTAGATTVQDFALTPRNLVAISGTVYDVNTNLPLYARLEISGAPNGNLEVYSNPADGTYTVDLPEGRVVTFDVTALVPGYLPDTRTLTVPASPATEDFPLDVDRATCNAPGYTFNVGFAEDFQTWPLTGWTVRDNAGNGVVWQSGTSWGVSNYITGDPTDEVAHVDSDRAGQLDYDTELISPSLDPATLPGLWLVYDANYQNFVSDSLDLDYSTDGGTTWTTILSWNEDHGAFRQPPGERVAVDLGPLVGSSTAFQIRWRYYNLTTSPDWDWYAQIDNVRIGDCVPTVASPGMIYGQVKDLVGNPVPGATISTGSTVVTPTMITSGPDAGKAMYFMSLAAGSYTVTGDWGGLQDIAANVTVNAGQTTRVDLTIGAVFSQVAGDYNGDGAVDVAVYRPRTGTWYISGIGSITFGKPGDIPVPADYDGDGVTETAVYRPGDPSEWFIPGQGRFVFGKAGDMPVPADYNGDGKAEIAVYRPGNPSTWYIAGVGNFTYGKEGDIPVPADYNGDGRVEIAVFRPGAPATWYIAGIGSFVYGTAPGDIPVPADYNGDGRAEIAVYRTTTTPDATWYIAGIGAFTYGKPTDFPIPADYNGDGRAELAVFRVGTPAQWFISGIGSFIFGTGDDIPVNPTFTPEDKP